MAQGIIFQLSSTSPIPANTAGIYVTSTGDLVHQPPSGSSQNISQVVSGGASLSPLTQIQLINGSGGTLNAYVPVSINSSGQLSAVNPSVESSSFSAIGITTQSIAATAVGNVATCGKVQAVSISGVNLGDTLFVNTNGGLTNIKPSTGVNGFTTGDFIIKIGIIVENTSSPTTMDLVVMPQVVGQL